MFFEVSLFNQKKIKNRITSIALALIGIAFVLWYNAEMSDWFTKEVLKTIGENTSSVQQDSFTIRAEYKTIALGIGILGVFFGIKSFNHKKWIALLGISLSIFLSSIAFYPIWKCLIQDSALDINFFEE